MTKLPLALADLATFFKLTFVNRSHEGLLSIIDKPLSKKHADRYIKKHKLLCKINDAYELAKGSMSPLELLNGLDFEEKNPEVAKRHLPKLYLQKTGQEELLKHHGEETPPPEEDYVDPTSKKIISEILLEDRIKQEREDRKRRKEIDKRRKYEIMSDDQRRAQGRLKLQKQVFGLRDFERHEIGFRSQFKNTLN